MRCSPEVPFAKVFAIILSQQLPHVRLYLPKPSEELGVSSNWTYALSESEIPRKHSGPVLHLR